MSISLDFLNDLNKQVEKMEGIGGSSEPPALWYSTGNIVLNRIISGSFHRGIPQGRITGLAGPSGAGKSYLIGNIVKSAQDEGAFCLVVDSENALDDIYMGGIGVDVDDRTRYNYRSVSTISQVIKLISGFIKSYEKEYGNIRKNPNQPPVLIALDSLDMLATDTELATFDKGDQKGDQGQRAKQLKAMLRQFVLAIKDLNIAIVVTMQVYAASAQQLLAGEGAWKINDAVRFAMSQIVLITKLKLKDDTVITGIRMKCEGFKTRFTKPFQTVTIEVPYDTGMNKHSGLLESLESIGILKRGGSWYTSSDGTMKFQSKNLEEYATRLIALAEASQGLYLKVSKVDDEEDDDQGETSKMTGEQRRKLLEESVADNAEPN